jgi:DNA-directed RNA polymerase subunit beta'
MVLGLYYITKPRKSTEDHPVKGEGKRFYSSEEVIIAYNEKRIDLHATINVKTKIREKDKLVETMLETTVGRVLFNEVVPEEFGFVNQLLTKKSLRDIIGNMVKRLGTAAAAQFLDDIKNLGFQMAYRGGLSFNLGNVMVPTIKEELIAQANEEVTEVLANYNMGFITNNERYNQIIEGV